MKQDLTLTEVKVREIGHKILTKVTARETGLYILTQVTVLKTDSSKSHQTLNHLFFAFQRRFTKPPVSLFAISHRFSERFIARILRYWSEPTIRVTGDVQPNSNGCTGTNS